MKLLRKRPYDPYCPVVFPPYGTWVLPDPVGLRAAMKGDTNWVLDIEPPVLQADGAAQNPTAEALGITDALLAPYGRHPSNDERIAIAARVQWGLTFARADIHRLGEEPPVAHCLVPRAHGRANDVCGAGRWAVSRGRSACRVRSGSPRLTRRPARTWSQFGAVELTGSVLPPSPTLSPHIVGLVAVRLGRAGRAVGDRLRG